MQSAEIGRIKLEGDVLDKVGNELKYFIKDGITRTPGLDVKTI